MTCKSGCEDFLSREILLMVWASPACCFLQTIENTRMKDVTIIAPDDDEVDADDAQDEFAGILRPAVQATIMGSAACITRIWQSIDLRRAPVSQRS